MSNKCGAQKARSVVLGVFILSSVVAFVCAGCWITKCNSSKSEFHISPSKLHLITLKNFSSAGFRGYYGWNDLSDETQLLWLTLGYNETIWNHGKAPTAWRQLSQREQDAAKALGYDEYSWNAGINPAVTVSVPPVQHVTLNTLLPPVPNTSAGLK
jgi:hypothetical protein